MTYRRLYRIGRTVGFIGVGITIAGGMTSIVVESTEWNAVYNGGLAGLVAGFIVMSAGAIVEFLGMFGKKKEERIAAALQVFHDASGDPDTRIKPAP